MYIDKKQAREEILMKSKIFRLMFLMMLLSLIFTGCGTTGKNTSDGSNKLVIYTSMKDSLIGGIVEGFKKEHPDIEVEYKTAGAGKLMEQIANERRNGKILADIIWTSEVPDFYQMKEEGLLEKYSPKALKEILNPFNDYDGFFTAARLGTLGIVVNTDKVKTPPVAWENLASQEAYKDVFGIADPKKSGTAFMSIALLKKQFGWGYIERLHRNGTVKCEGSKQVIEQTVNGNLSACIGVDYIAANYIDNGAHVIMIYPKEMIVVPSPVAIFKNSDNLSEAKIFVEYMLGKEAQQKIADAGSIPIRSDVTMSEKYHLPSPTEALKMGIKIDYLDILQHKEEIKKKFSELFD